MQKQGITRPPFTVNYTPMTVTVFQHRSNSQPIESSSFLNTRVTNITERVSQKIRKTRHLRLNATGFASELTDPASDVTTAPSPFHSNDPMETNAGLGPSHFVEAEIDHSISSYPMQAEVNMMNRRERVISYL